MSVRAPITPEVIKWARESARLSLEQAAKKVKRPVSDLMAWEDGTLKPTMPQARKAAEVYKRPLAVFYLPEPPRGWQVLRDFRTLPADSERGYSSELAFLIRETQVRQEWMQEYLQHEGFAALPFVGSHSIVSPPDSLAQEIRDVLDISETDIRRCRTRREALNLWMGRAEEAGIFVFRDSGIACEEARAFVLCDPYAPFIFLNSTDAQVAQIFSLAHELAHVWIDATGVSNLENRGRFPDDDSEKIEVFCNKVASYTVLPPREFDAKWSSQPANAPLDEKIEMLSNHFRISRETIARRLLDKDLIVRTKYRELRNRYKEEWFERREALRHKRKKQDRGPSPHLLKVIRKGRTFTRAVLGAYYSGRIPGRDAAVLLEAKLNHFSKLADLAGVFTMPSSGGARR